LDRDAVGACAGAIAHRAGVGGSTRAITINEGATASAVAALGIAASSENSARAELDAGKLVRVLPDWDFGSMEVNALFANGSGQGIAVTARHSPQLLIQYLYPTLAENLTLAKHAPRPSALALEVLHALRRHVRERSEMPVGV
jgi:DNA-binding transcriptional LysR family regulator